VLLGHDDAAIDLAEALAVVRRNYGPVAGTEAVALTDAYQRILSHDVIAPISVPGADNSAVDGYAFGHADLARDDGTAFRVAGTATAGHPYVGPVRAGEAVRIFTGAVVPDGVDTIVPQEKTSADKETVTISAGPRLGDNRRLAGEDIAIGTRILSAGDRLGPAAIGVLASLGIAEIDVRMPLKVAVFSTGDELCEASATLAPGKIYDSNRPVLLAMLEGLGISATDLGILPDDEGTIRVRLSEAAADHDAVICSAGMSVGDEDHVKTAVRALGALDFWSVAIKPGRPIAIGQIARTPFFGLPGNPVAMIVTFAMIVRPALLRLAGSQAVEPRRFPVIADFTLARRPGTREYLRCSLSEAGGRLLAQRFQRAGSGVLSSVSGSEGLLEIAEDIVEIVPGMVLPFIPFSAFGL
jgi:molybdopterin molybdotransferase